MEVEVCYATATLLQPGERVEVYGYYWKQSGPMQCMGRITASPSPYYVIRI